MLEGDFIIEEIRSPTQTHTSDKKGDTESAWSQFATLVARQLHTSPERAVNFIMEQNQDWARTFDRWFREVHGLATPDLEEPDFVLHGSEDELEFSMHINEGVVDADISELRKTMSKFNIFAPLHWSGKNHWTLVINQPRVI